MNIGDKVKFDTYISINPFTHQYYRKPIVPTERGEYRSNRRVVLTDDIVVKKIATITHNTPIEGIYVGYCYKKLEWRYRITTEEENTELNPQPLRHRGLIVEHRIIYERNRRSTHNPRRLDDPYKLDKVALINMGVGRIIEVPMINIIKYNCLDKYKFL